MGFLSVSSLMSLFFAGMLSLLVGLINAQQLIVHLPIMSVVFPQNAMSFIKDLMAIVMLDVLEFFKKDDDELDNGEDLNIQQ